MLELRPNCECCDRDLPPESDQARICTFECTFCLECAEGRFAGRCPNCGGDLARRPVRPSAMLARYPASTQRFVKAHAECASATGRPGGRAAAASGS
jgi:uncharacterized protein